MEFATHVIRVQANLVIVSMAWLTQEDEKTYFQKSEEPDINTLSYWLSRLEPVIRAEAQGEVIVVLANRCGVEEDAVYAGTSAVLGLNGGEVKVYGLLGRGEKELLVVDTSKHADMKLVSESNSVQSTVDGPTPENSTSTSPGFEESQVDMQANDVFSSESHEEQQFNSASSVADASISKPAPPAL